METPTLDKLRRIFGRNIAYLHKESNTVISKLPKELKYFVDPIWTMPIKDFYTEYNLFQVTGCSRIIYLCSIVNITQCLAKIKMDVVKKTIFDVDFFAEKCREDFSNIYQLLHSAFLHVDAPEFWSYDAMVEIYDSFVRFLRCLGTLNEQRLTKERLNKEVTSEFGSCESEINADGEYFTSCKSNPESESDNVRVLFVFVVPQEHKFARIAGLRLAALVTDPLIETHLNYEERHSNLVKSGYAGIIETVCHDIIAHGVFRKKNTITIRDEHEFEKISCFIDSHNPIYMGFSHYFFSETEANKPCTKLNGNYKSYLKAMIEFHCRFHGGCLYFGDYSAFQMQNISKWMYKHWTDFKFKSFDARIQEKEIRH